jgi:hypothetical protein
VESVLPDKIARFLYEFHDFRFESLDLPPYPQTGATLTPDVHGALGDAQVPKMLISIEFIVCIDESYYRYYSYHSYYTETNSQ